MRLSHAHLCRVVHGEADIVASGKVHDEPFNGRRTVVRLVDDLESARLGRNKTRCLVLKRQKKKDWNVAIH